MGMMGFQEATLKHILDGKYVYMEGSQLPLLKCEILTSFTKDFQHTFY